MKIFLLFSLSFFVSAFVTFRYAQGIQEYTPETIKIFFFFNKTWKTAKTDKEFYLFFFFKFLSADCRLPKHNFLS